MSSQAITIDFAGHEIELSPHGLIWIAEARLLCAADLHFEKGSFFSRFATFLPPYDTAETLRRLKQAVARYQPETFIALGDSFHDGAAGSRMQAADIAQLNELIISVNQWFWLTGNHDPEIAEIIKGQRREIWQWQNITFRHQSAGAADNTSPEISGHFHPKTRISIRGHGISGACFVHQATRLILPAFGAFTGGLDIDSAAFPAIMPRDNRVAYLLHRDRIFKVQN